MENKLHVALVTNYRPDGQYSMLRFADMLEEGLSAAGIGVTRLEPAKVFGGKGPLAKWRGYADKYLLFPRKLRRELKRLAAAHPGLVVHVTDHANAPYLAAASGMRGMINCHDLMAIKSALGLVPQNPTRFTGRILQRWILKHLKTAHYVTCISEKTREDLLTLTSLKPAQTRVIYMGLPYAFEPQAHDQAVARISPLQQPYVLHVGSDAWYKNRSGTLGIYLKLRKTRPELRLAFVGPPEASLEETIEKNMLGSHVSFIRDITDEKLEALYSAAEALIFPSFEEGFGWPIAEAQACGCPAFITDRAPMTEVGGDAAVRIPLAPGNYEDREQWAAECATIILKNCERRDALCAAGLENAKRFAPTVMLEQYIATYHTLLNHSS